MTGAASADGTVLGSSPPMPISESPRRERLRYIQMLRVVAILIVVGTHTRDLFDQGDVMRSPYIGLLTRSINIIFIFVSGFLFEYLSRSFEYRRYLSTKLRNVILPYVFCSIPAILIYVVGIKSIAELEAPAFIDTMSKAVPFMILTGTHLAPFWFIPMMAIYYLVSPVLLEINRRPSLYLLIVPLLVLSMFLGRSPGDTSPLHNALFYLPVYLAGMAASHFRDTFMPRVATLFPILLLGVLLPLPFVGERSVDGIYLLSKILVCFGIVGVVYRWADRLPDWVLPLGEASFGIYFVHYYIVAALNMAKAKVPWIDFQGPLAFLILFVLISSLSFVLVWLVQRTTRFSRQLIGA